MSTRRKPAKPAHRLDPASVPDFHIAHREPAARPSKATAKEAHVVAGMVSAALPLRTWRALFETAVAAGFRPKELDADRGGSLSPAECRAFARALEGVDGLMAALQEGRTARVMVRKCIDG